jgi:hypothetical protein
VRMKSSRKCNVSSVVTFPITMLSWIASISSVWFVSPTCICRGRVSRRKIVVLLIAHSVTIWLHWMWIPYRLYRLHYNPIYSRTPIVFNPIWMWIYRILWLRRKCMMIIDRILYLEIEPLHILIDYSRDSNWRWKIWTISNRLKAISKIIEGTHKYRIPIDYILDWIVESNLL